jgi:ParB/RepB/Spo0J family partition protein
MTAPTTAPMAPDIRIIPFAQIHESPLNTRRHFDPVKLQELADSMGTTGQLEPVLVRPSKLKGKPGFELASGHRRRRAGEIAKIPTLVAIVRDLDDRTFLEILTIANLQREDVHPLEEAQGYKNLLTLDGYNHKLIAERVGKADSYVYDRLKLLQLIPEAKELFFKSRFTLAHAILLARIPAKDQERAIEPEADTRRDGGLWRGEGDAHPTLDFPADDEKDPFRGLVARSPRELQAWIDTFVRFDPTDKAVPQLFPQTAATLADATAKKEKVVSITRDYHVDPDAKDPEGKRTFGPTSWKRADGQPEEDRLGNEKLSKPCDYSVIGIVSVGEGRGDSFRVCVDKKRCTTHWGAEINARNKRERERESAPKSPMKSSFDSNEAAVAKRKAEQAARDAEAKRWEKARPAVLTAIGNAIKKAPTNSASPIATYVWDLMTDGLWGLDKIAKGAAKYVPRGVSSSDFLCHLTMCALFNLAENNDAREVAEDVKKLKLPVDVAKIVDAIAPKAQPKPEPKKAEAKPAPAKKASAKKAKKAGRKRAVADFMKPKHPDAALAAIVGEGAMPRTEITKKLWQYIKKHQLQDAKERRNIKPTTS